MVQAINLPNMKRIAVYSASRLYYEAVVPSVKSMLTNGNIDEVWIMTQDDYLPFWVPDNVHVLNVSNQPWFKPGTPNYRNEYSFICMVRTALAKLFPDADRILALDADTIILEDISGLWDLDMTDTYLAGVPEFRLSAERGYPYINMGVGFWNLAKVREDHLDDRMIEALNKKRYQWLEQDCINEFCKGHVIPIDPGYNYSWFCEETKKVRILHLCAMPNWREHELVMKYNAVDWEQKPIVLYVCDGKKPCADSPGCFMNGGECNHTRDENHARYKTNERHESVHVGNNGSVTFWEEVNA